MFHLYLLDTEELPKEKRSVMTLRLKVKSNSSSNFDDEAVGEAILKEVSSF